MRLDSIISGLMTKERHGKLKYILAFQADLTIFVAVVKAEKANKTMCKEMLNLVYFPPPPPICQIAMETATASPLRIPTEILLLLYKENLFTVHSVHELLWGYRDKFLDTVHKFSPSIEPDFGYFKKVNFLLAKG